MCEGEEVVVVVGGGGVGGDVVAVGAVGAVAKETLAVLVELRVLPSMVKAQAVLVI